MPTTVTIGTLKSFSASQTEVHTSITGFTAVGRRNWDDLNSIHQSLIHQKLAKLKKCPGIRPSSLGFSSRLLISSFSNASQICPECGTHTGKKELSQRDHVCDECGYQTTRDHASGRVILNRGIELINSTDGLSGKEIACQVVLSGVSCLDKWRFGRGGGWGTLCISNHGVGAGKSNSRDLEAYTDSENTV